MKLISKWKKWHPKCKFDNWTRWNYYQIQRKLVKTEIWYCSLKVENIKTLPELGQTNLNHFEELVKLHDCFT